MRQHAVERDLDPTRQVVEVASELAQQDVQPDGEHLLLAALEGIAQALGVLVGDLALGIGEPAATCFEQSRRMRLHHLVGEGRDHGLGLEREQVQAQLDRLLEVDQRLEPAWADASRVSVTARCGRTDSRGDVVAGDLQHRRRDQVGEERVPRAKRRPSALRPC